MSDRPPETHWMADPPDMLEKIHHDHERLKEGVKNLRGSPKEAHYAAYDFLTSAYHSLEWVGLCEGPKREKDLKNCNALFNLVGEVVNGVKHCIHKGPEESTQDEGDFSSHDFSSEDFNTDDLRIEVTEKRAREVKEVAKGLGVDPDGLVQKGKEISVLVLADRLVEFLDEVLRTER